MRATFKYGGSPMLAPNHSSSTIGHVLTIWIPNMFGIKILTVTFFRETTTVFVLDIFCKPKHMERISSCHISWTTITRLILSVKNKILICYHYHIITKLQSNLHFYSHIKTRPNFWLQIFGWPNKVKLKNLQRFSKRCQSFLPLN